MPLFWRISPADLDDSPICGSYTPGTSFTIVASGAASGSLIYGGQFNGAYRHVDFGTDSTAFIVFALNSNCNLVDSAGNVYGTGQDNSDYVTYFQPNSNPSHAVPLICSISNTNTLGCTVGGNNENQFSNANAHLNIENDTEYPDVTLTIVPQA